MQTFGAFLVSFLLASDLAWAIPSRLNTVKRRGQTASLPVKRNTSFKKNGPLALAKAYSKYGKTLPQSLKTIVAAHQASRRATASATNSPADSLDSEYLTNVQIGTPAQTLPLDFDTGSSDLWVFSSETPSNEVNGQTTFALNKSSTAKEVSGATWKTSYGDGSSSSGDVYTDVVSIGNLSVTDQAIESATTVSSQFTSESSMSGLVGLAFRSLNRASPTKQSTFFENAIAQLDKPVFTSDLKHNADGSYNFGYIDSSAYTGDIYYTSVDNSSGYWGFTATGYAVGDGSAATSSSSPSSPLPSLPGTPSRPGSSGGSKRSVKLNDTKISGIADTGTTLLMLPSTVLQAYYEQVSSAEDSETEGGVVFDCDEDLPDFTFGIGNGQITVPGAYINYSPVDEQNSSCYGGIQSSDSVGFAIFGDVALKASFVVFNGETLQLGWAAKDL